MRQHLLETSGTGSKLKEPSLTRCQSQLLWRQHCHFWFMLRCETLICEHSGDHWITLQTAHWTSLRTHEDTINTPNLSADSNDHISFGFRVSVFSVFTSCSQAAVSPGRLLPQWIWVFNWTDVAESCQITAYWMESSFINRKASNNLRYDVLKGSLAACKHTAIFWNSPG